MTAETKKILDPAIELVAHCVRIPVFVGHSEAVFIETEKPMTETGVRTLLEDAEGDVFSCARSSSFSSSLPYATHRPSVCAMLASLGPITRGGPLPLVSTWYRMSTYTHS